MYKNAMKYNETVGKWCINKHGASKIIDTLETYQGFGDPQHQTHELGSNADLICAKYLGDRDLFDQEFPTCGSHIWKAIQKNKWHFMLGAKHKVHNRKQTYFWLDLWTRNAPLRAFSSPL
jgi:hypothetical protein